MADSNTIGGIHYEMMRRCYNPNCVAYGSYGAKGIKVCEEWHDREAFRAWCLANGYRKGQRVDRVDSSKDYCPENCFLGEVSTQKTNGKNRIARIKRAEYKDAKNALGITTIASHRLNSTFRSMHNRCKNQNHKAYKHYGGRGIKVCERWSGKFGFVNFVKWSQTHGWKEGLTLDRIDCDKGYSPTNCRWTTWEVQGKNKRNVHLHQYHGQMLLVREIAELENISESRIKSRMKKYGISAEKAVECLKGNG